MRALAIAVLIALAAPAAAQTAADDPAATLAAAQDALAAGDYDRAAQLAGAVASREQAAKTDFAEAHRLLGLAWFFLGDHARAEAELLAYLRLDLDGRLDPSLVPPEAVTFFEDVRSRHAAELRKLRPRQRRYAILNLVPPGGQIQNREHGKAWTVGGLEVALAATHLTTYFLLRSWCGRADFTCTDGDVDVTDKARKVRTVNYAAGIALIGVYVYGVLDGYRGYRRHGRERAEPVVMSVEGGAVIGASVRW